MCVKSVVKSNKNDFRKEPIIGKKQQSHAVTQRIQNHRIEEEQKREMKLFGMNVKGIT